MAIIGAIRGHHSLGDGRMSTSAPRRSIDHAEIAALRARLRERRLVDPDDFLLIDDLLGIASELTVALAHKRASLARLRRLVFGPSSDRRVIPASDPPSPDTDPTTTATTDAAPSPLSSTASESPRGHGRRPASAYPGARRVDCTNALRPGDRCPECFGTLRRHVSCNDSIGAARAALACAAIAPECS